MLSNTTLFRLSGIALLIGSGLGVTAHLLHPDEPNGPTGLATYAAATVLPHTLLIVGILLLLLGLPAVFLRQNTKTGIANLLGSSAYSSGSQSLICCMLSSRLA